MYMYSQVLGTVKNAIVVFFGMFFFAEVVTVLQVSALRVSTVVCIWWMGGGVKGVGANPAFWQC